MKSSPVISLVAALSLNHVIGKENLLPWHLEADWEHFKEYTAGLPMIMGRVSAQSEVALYSDVRNIVLSSMAQLSLPFEHEIAHTLQEAITRLQACETILIIGGDTVFRQALDKADEMVLTHVETVCEGDAFFPEFDRTEWTQEVLQTQKQDTFNTHPFTIIHWKRK